MARISFCERGKGIHFYTRSTLSVFLFFLCVVPPCPAHPPPPPSGGWRWLEAEYTKYKCPNGFKFKTGQYPYWYMNCTARRNWYPEAVEDCIRKLNGNVHFFPLSLLFFCSSLHHSPGPVQSSTIAEISRVLIP